MYEMLTCWKRTVLKGKHRLGDCRAVIGGKVHFGMVEHIFRHSPKTEILFIRVSQDRNQTSQGKMPSMFLESVRPSYRGPNIKTQLTPT